MYVCMVLEYVCPELLRLGVSVLRYVQSYYDVPLAEVSLCLFTYGILCVYGGCMDVCPELLHYYAVVRLCFFAHLLPPLLHLRSSSFTGIHSDIVCCMF